MKRMFLLLPAFAIGCYGNVVVEQMDPCYGVHSLECSNTTVWWDASSRRECAKEARPLVYPQLPYNTWAVVRFQAQAGYRPTRFQFSMMANAFPIDHVSLVWFIASSEAGNPSQGFYSTEVPTIWGPGSLDVALPYADARTSDEEEYIYVAVNTTSPSGQRFGMEGCGRGIEPDASWIGNYTSAGMSVRRIKDSPGYWMSDGAYDWVATLGGKFPQHEAPGAPQ